MGTSEKILSYGFQKSDLNEIRVCVRTLGNDFGWNVVKEVRFRHFGKIVRLNEKFTRGNELGFPQMQ